MSFTFLMCSERSGSNFITKLLNAHSQIAGPSPKHLFNPVVRNLFRYEPVDNEENWDELLHDIHNLLNVDFSYWVSTFSVEQLREFAEPGDTASLLQEVFLKEASHFGKKHIFVKENQVYEFFPFLLLHFPHSRYVYQVRDPRDMALSWKKSNIHPGGVIQAARQWKKDQQQSLKNYYELQKMGLALKVKYEELITETKKNIKRIVEFMGLQFERTMLDFHQDKMVERNAESQEAWNNLSRSVMSDNKSKYLNELTEQEIRYIERICLNEMIFLGYYPQFRRVHTEKINEEELNEYHRYEMANLELKPTGGVLANMKAKKVFYTKQIQK